MNDNQAFFDSYAKDSLFELNSFKNTILLDDGRVLEIDLFNKDIGQTSIMMYMQPASVDPYSYRVNCIELQLILGGAAAELINGKQIILKENSLLILNRNVIRKFEKLSPEVQIIRIFINQEIFDQKFFSLVLEDNIFANYIYKSLFIKKDYNDFVVINDINQDVIEILKSINKEIKSNTSEKSNRTIYSWLAVLFLRLYDYCISVEQDKSDEKLDLGYKNKIVSEIISFIKSNIKNASLSAVSQHVHLHQNYICKIIKDVTSKTFTEILNIMKMEAAMTLLEMTDCSLDEVSRQIGYNNPNYFYKVFKSYSSLTPGQYRKKCRDRGNNFLGSINAAMVEFNKISTIDRITDKDENNVKTSNYEELFAKIKYSPETSPNIGFFPAAGYKYIMAVGKGLEISASQYNGKVMSYVPSQDDINEQIKLLNRALEENLDAIIVNTHDEYAVGPILKKFIDKGVMVCLINCDNSDFPVDVHAIIGYRQRYSTFEIGKYAVEKMGGLPARVGIIQGKTGYHSIERCGGFLDAIKDHDNFELVSILNGNWSSQGGYSAAMEMLQSHHNLNVIFCANDHEAIGVVKAIKELNLKNIILLGNDGDSLALENIVLGNITATVGTNPYEMGRVAAQVIQRGLLGQFKGGYVETTTQIVDKKNVQIYLNLAQSYGEKLLLID